MRSWIAILVLLVGCGHRQYPFHYIQNGGYSVVPLKVIPIWVDASFGAADKVAIDDALTQWNYALNGYVRLQLVNMEFAGDPEVIKRVDAGDGWIIYKTDNKDSRIPDSGKDHRTLAWANYIGGNRIYIIRERLSNEWVTGITLHEVGHLLGAPHDEVYLMQPYYNWEAFRCVDYEALRMVAEYRHIPMSQLNYCIRDEVNLKN